MYDILKILVDFCGSFPMIWTLLYVQKSFNSPMIHYVNNDTLVNNNNSINTRLKNVSLLPTSLGLECLWDVPGRAGARSGQ